jgi:hypothetical protein
MASFKGASLPKLEAPGSWSEITDSLRGLNTFAQSEWSPLARTFAYELLRFVEQLSFNSDHGRHNMVLLTLWVNRRISEFIRCLRRDTADWSLHAAKVFERLSPSDPEYWNYALSAFAQESKPNINGKRIHASGDQSTVGSKKKAQTKQEGFRSLTEIAPHNADGKELCVLHLTSRGCTEHAKGKKTCGKGEVKRLHERPSSVSKEAAEIITNNLGGWAAGYSPKVLP